MLTKILRKSEQNRRKWFRMCAFVEITRHSAINRVSRYYFLLLEVNVEAVVL